MRQSLLAFLGRAVVPTLPTLPSGTPTVIRGTATRVRLPAPAAVQTSMLAQQEERLAAAGGPDLELVFPPTLLPYQIEPARALATAVKRFGAALDASDTGTGKTYTACGVAKALRFSLAVVCPKAVIPAWERVAAEFGLNVVFVLNYEKIKNGKTPWCRGKAQSFVGAYGNGVHTQREDFKWLLNANTLLVLDEAHRCKGHTSVNSKLMMAARVDNIPTLALSATVASNPTEMKALGYLLRLFERGQFWTWCKRYGCIGGSYGGLEFNGDQRVLHSLHRQIFPSRGARIRISDLGDAFPSRVITAEAYNLGAQTAEVQAAYAAMEDALAALDERTANYAAGALGIMLKARMKAELLKVPMMVDMVKDLLEEGSSVAVFVNFTDTVTRLVEKLDRQVPGGAISLVVGGQTAEGRESAIARFQADDSRLIIANIKAGGIGISLHDLNGRFPRVGLVCPTFSAIDLVQVLGRLHRSGALSPAMYRILFAAGTVEEIACRAVRGKLQNLAILNDGDLRAGINLGFNH